MRRQKCDRKDPCTRCVQKNEGSSCSREWHDGYDPQVHRTYPKSKVVQVPTSTIPLESNNDGVVPQNGARDASLAQDAATTQPTFRKNNIANPQCLLGTTFANNMSQTARNGFRPSRAGNDPTSSEFLTNVIVKPSNFDPFGIRSSIDPRLSAGNSEHSSGQSRVDLCPRAIEKHYLQTLIPTNRQILQLVEYHDAYLL